MSMTSADVGNYAPGHTIRHKGRIYPFRFLDDKMLAGFERQKFALERDRLRSQREMVTEDLGETAYARMMLDVWEKYRNHEYSFFACLQSGELDAKNLETLTLLLSLMMDCPQEEVLEIFLAHRNEITELLRLVITESIGESLPAQPDDSRSDGPDRLASGGLPIDLANGESPPKKP